MRPSHLFLFLFFTPLFIQAQDVTGIWQGHFKSSGSSLLRNSIFDERYRFEVQIAQEGKKFQGVTYSYLSTFFYGKAEAAGTVNVHTAKVLLQEGKLLEYRNDGGGVCIMTCFLQYSKYGTEEFLEGTYSSMSVKDSSNCGRGTVLLHKVPMSDFYTEPFVAKREREIANTDSLKNSQKMAALKPAVKPMGKPPVGQGANRRVGPVANPTVKSGTGGGTSADAAIAKKGATLEKNGAAAHHPANPPAKPATPERKGPPVARVDIPKQPLHAPGDSSGNGIGRRFPTIAPRVLVDRENRLVRTITVHTNEVTLNIYDDGAIDHDTVSVYVDNKQVIDHAMLTDRPLVVTLHLDETVDYHEVVMVAENEGEIPPNTSLMIVKAGDKEYEVRITSTEQKNAVVRFQYAK